MQTREISSYISFETGRLVFLKCTLWLQGFNILLYSLKSPFHYCFHRASLSDLSHALFYCVEFECAVWHANMNMRYEVWGVGLIQMTWLGVYKIFHKCQCVKIRKCCMILLVAIFITWRVLFVLYHSSP